jgi:choline dehydrogenase-like flavoprotein
MEKRLLYPPSGLKLVTVIEQMPVRDNRITLASETRDIHGNPLAKITWRTNQTDLLTFRTLQQALCEWWAQSRFTALAKLEATPEPIWSEQLRSGSDIFHPGGTTRMGRSATTGVVDPNLRVFSVPNLHVVSTSTFPSGGGSNPTFMLMAFALRAATHLAEQLAHRSVCAVQPVRTTAVAEAERA